MRNKITIYVCLLRKFSSKYLTVIKYYLHTNVIFHFQIHIVANTIYLLVRHNQVAANWETYPAVNSSKPLFTIPVSCEV